MGPPLRPEDTVQDGKHISLSYNRPNRHTARAVLNKLAASDCNNQEKSPLFRLLSPEIRNRIFSLVLQPIIHQATAEVTKASLKGVYEKELASNEVACVHSTVDTALLFSCRLVYLETRFLPVCNAVHDFFGYRSIRFGRGVHSPEIPFYGEGKIGLRSGPAMQGSASIWHRKMSAALLAKIQQISLYDFGRETYATGHDMFGIKALRQRRIFMACPFDAHESQYNMKKGLAWHETLEELELRVDAPPKDRKKLQEAKTPQREIKRVGGRVLTLVDSESNIQGTWAGFNNMGEDAQWHSMTYLWRVLDSLDE